MKDGELIKRAKIASEAGIKIVWIGEFEGFKDPFYVAELIADFVDFVGFGILSPIKRKYNEIFRLLSKFDRKIVVGIAPGNFNNPKEALEMTIDCIKYLKKRLEVPVLAGCSSPIITKKSSEMADGILFNYVKSEYIRWISKFVKKKLFIAAYGPSLILPSEFFEDLLIASAIVVSSKAFVKEFGFDELFEEIRQIDFQKLVEIRQMGKSIKHTPDYKILDRYSNILLENFTISGDVNSITIRIKDLLEHCNHVILSDPFFRDANSMRLLKHVADVVTNNP
ncbi:hypothetical protein DRP05_02640 [Archaeoglobales archaeon]|nr:MAG: hypothetical protein DRP05_02640 [Archaeoglobales archaeon]